jgi:signal transduction histidine kinase
MDIRHALLVLFADRGLDIPVQGDHAVCVRCDRADLAEMLGNLMENACKWFSGRVRVTVVRIVTDVVAIISDDRPGLPEAQLRAVRERGVRLDETMPGSGLGVAIAEDLAALYGGGLDLEAQGPDGALAVRLTLPATAEPAW